MSTLDFHLNSSTQQSRGRADHRVTRRRNDTSDRETALTALGQLSPSSSEPTTQGSSPGMPPSRVTTVSDDARMLDGPVPDVLGPPWPAHLPDPGFSGGDESGNIPQLNWMQGIEDAAIPHALDGGFDVASFLRDMPVHSTAESTFSRLSAELHLDGGVMGNALCRVSPNSDVDTTGYGSQLSPSEVETALSTRCPTEDIPLVRVGRGNRGENRVDVRRRPVHRFRPGGDTSFGELG
ncbi:hypothetical protein LX32DRAFT_694772 [Colletotrichum zoysiae]|uniref:Uncharacterized protein n=1 Tax=Colletotrichum zoysiae TaxID=1216348 RepID=A0AAD9HEM0_9PEZI|nr:hypothetical protein LX32DRAFT_694772 [Colletotrichum zoysiae]